MANARKDNNRIPTLLGTSSVDGVTPVLIYADPITHRLKVDNIGGSSLTLLPATGTINGVNADFTFTTKPTYIVSDGAWYRENIGWTWNSGTLTATMSVPPQTDIWGF